MECHPRARRPGPAVGSAQRHSHPAEMGYPTSAFSQWALVATDRPDMLERLMEPPVVLSTWGADRRVLALAGQTYLGPRSRTKTLDTNVSGRSAPDGSSWTCRRPRRSNTVR